jgi:hypothetical protein
VADRLPFKPLVWRMAAVEDRLVHPAGSAVGEGSALSRAAVAAGHGKRVQELLDNGWPGSTDEDVDLILWAADYGAYQVIHNRLGGYLPDWGRFASRETVEAALRLARRWVDVDAVAELRRRLGNANTLVRETVMVDDYTHAERIRATAADGRWAEAQTAHLAIVTYLEDRLGSVASRDDLMARALMGRDPDSCNWSQSWFSVKNMPDDEATLRWAITVLTEPDPDARRFAAEVVHSLSLDQEEPYPEYALAALRTRLSVELDAGVLVSLILAFSNYHSRGVPPEVVAHAEHPDPGVRGAVAHEHYGALSDPGAAPGAVETLAKLARDRDGRVRATALRVFRDYAFDHPVTGRFIAAGRDDSDPRVRAEALAGLARGGDTAAYEELRRLGDEAGEGSSLAWMADAAEGWIGRQSRTG